MKNNIRELCLVLDLECKKVLPLITMESNALDQYIFENFEDSSSIRKCFKEKIGEYLLKNKSYLETIYKNTGRKTEGSIVILQLSDIGYTIRKSVLYKKRVKEVNDFLTIKTKSQAFSKEEFIFYLLKQNTPNLFFSNYEIDVLKKEYKYFSKTRKQDFLYYLFNDLKKRVFQNNDKIRDFYSILKKYKPVKQIPIVKSTPIVVETEQEDIDPDKIYLDTPTIYPVYDDKLDEYDKVEKGHSLKYTYKPYHRR